MVLVKYIVLAFLRFTSAANILAVVPSPTFSHQSTFWPIWKELSLRGHKVTLLTTNPIANETLTNLTEYSFHEAYAFKRELEKVIDTADTVTLIKVFARLTENVSEYFFKQRIVQDLLNSNESKKYDIVMVEGYYLEFLIFGDIYKCPTIIVHSTNTLKMIHQAMGNTIHPVVYSNKQYTCNGTLAQSFYDRLENYIDLILSSLIRYFYTDPIRNGILKKYVGQNAPTITYMLNKVDMLFMNIHPVLHGGRLLGMSTVTFGAGVHLRPPKPLPKDIQTFLDDGKEGVIYFSLGASFKASHIKEVKKETILETFRELPYKVLYKYENDDLRNVSENVKIIKWAPQQDILRHPNVKLFITQGGQQSIEEAIFNGVPMVVIPLAVDQVPNAKKIECEGLGRHVDQKPTLQKQQFKDAILEVIGNDRYSENVRRTAELLLDEPMSGIEKVVWWTEYVIRHKGAKHLRSPSLDVPLYELLMLDVAAFLIGVMCALVLTLILLYRTVAYTFRTLTSRNGTKRKVQ